MSAVVFIRGLGVVSPAGWGVEPFAGALRAGEPLPIAIASRPGSPRTLRSRNVLREGKPPVLAHPRLRRTSLITQYTVAAGFEALGEDAALVQQGRMRLGIVLCLMPGCVTYSRRFYEEVLKDPATASPLLFPETVYNAPASHLAACLNSPGKSCTLVGDESSFFQGLALAAGWLLDDELDGCLVIGAEEMDWIVAEAVHLFHRNLIHSEGAGALYLSRTSRRPRGVELTCITDIFARCGINAVTSPAAAVRSQLESGNEEHALHCGSARGLFRLDEPERRAWKDWRGQRLAPVRITGDAFTASAAWQCVAACQAIESGEFNAASVTVMGASNLAVGARFQLRA